MTRSRRNQRTKLSRAISSVPGIMVSPLAPARSRGTCFSMSFNYLFDKCRAVEDASLGSQVSLWTGRWRSQQVRGRGTFVHSKSCKIPSFEVPSCIIYLRCMQYNDCIFNISDAISCNIRAVIEMRWKNQLRGVRMDRSIILIAPVSRIVCVEDMARADLLVMVLSDWWLISACGRAYSGRPRANLVTAAWETRRSDCVKKTEELSTS